MKFQALEMNCYVLKMRFCYFNKGQKKLHQNETLILLLCKKSCRRCGLNLNVGEKKPQNTKKKLSIFKPVSSCDVSSVRISRERKLLVYKLRKEWSDLEAECLSLKNENILLASELQRQEKELHSSQKQSLALTSDLSVLEMTRKQLENQVGSLKEQHQRDAASLKTLLSEAENQAKDVQKEYEKTQTVLSELKLGTRLAAARSPPART
uniref:Uncharacterized protein n=1 Tax=Gopherus agassizii TaxID=38772 RepID=A0A452HWE4_9SAUR